MKLLFNIKLIKRARRLEDREVLKHFDYHSYKAAIAMKKEYGNGLHVLILMDIPNKPMLDNYTLDKKGTTALIGAGGASIFYEDVNIFFRDWEILDRRVLVEKTKCL